MASAQFKIGNAGVWHSAEVTGTVPAVDKLGQPIVKIEPLVAVTDEDPSPGAADFALIDNVRLEVDLPVSGIPPHGLTGSPTTMDQDGNGYPDVWEAMYGAGHMDPDGDEDNDGIRNRDEAAAGTDPFNPGSGLWFRIAGQGPGTARLSWPNLVHRTLSVEGAVSVADSNGWGLEPLSPVLAGDAYQADVASGSSSRFYRLQSTEDDVDGDSVADWIEEWLGFSAAPGASNSVSKPRGYDTDGDGVPDTLLPGDLAMFNEIYRSSETNARPTEAQAARFLLQTTFGPTTADIHHLRDIGIDAWIDEQVALPATYTLPYILAIKADFNATNKDPALAGYVANNDFVFGVNYMTAWMRSAVRGEDQLRQRVAWALSQILVASMGGADLANQPQAIAHYYDQFLDEAFGNYEVLLNKVSRHPVMGRWLSSLGNQKADPSIGRYPDENYAREIMQLFSIGLWQLNPDGTQKLDAFGEPIPTYGNEEITEVARVFTGVNYAAGSFGGGWRDDGFYMTTPMKIFATHHDFGAKTIFNGIVIPARAASDANAVLDVEDVVHHLVRHTNTAPFICRQLIQFLVTSNPSTGYVHRVASKFVDNGSGEVGDMEAVVRAIITDPEARNPMQHLGTTYFGHLREPTVRIVHLARVMRLGDHPNLLWWDWGNYRADSLQQPMHAPSVFNYYRPDFRLFGQLSENGLDSPAFGIVSSYSAISFPNRMWTICKDGFKQSNYNYPPDWSDLTPLSNDVPALLDRVNLLFCAGTMSARSREIITTSVQSTGDATQRARLATYLALNCPEGACLK